MKTTKLLTAAAICIGGISSMNAQLIDEKDVTVTLDLQPVLQLDMTTPNQIEFVFDEISEYYSGITQYGATILKVSSTVSWDLYAVGRSTGTNGPEFWDQQIDYGNGASLNAIADLPLSLLELRQNQVNNGAAGATGAFSDYSATFSPSATAAGGNSLYVNGGTNTPPTLNDKYIGGHSGATGIAGADFLPGGSYLTSAGTFSDYYYAIDYRILPGLPAIFPMAFDANGTTPEDIVAANAPGNYAEPGVYTMYVQYILLEDQ
jgi:hypothetical protein